MKRAPIPTAAEIMQKKLVTVRSDDGIEDAVRRLIKKGYSGAPVVDGAGSLVGVLSEHDCIRVMAQAIAESWPGGTVEQQMTRQVETVPPTEDALALSTRFTHGRHRRLLVVEDGRLVGIVSRRDLMKALEKVEKAIDHARDKSTYDVMAERHRALD
jgi:CBS domain-containing protein